MERMPEEGSGRRTATTAGSARVLLVLPLLLWMGGCAGDADDAGGAGAAGEGAGAAGAQIPPRGEDDLLPRDAFWSRLASECGNAYSGGLTLEPPGDDMLTGTEELVVHFRECDDDALRIPFHIELEEDGSWDRSRTWVLTRAGEGLELRHDHREPDGSPSDNTLYGGFSETPGTAGRQEFVSAQRTEESGYSRGWRVEIIPGERYTYGTTRRGEWSWRIDFDLSRPVPPPPPPWGGG